MLYLYELSSESPEKVVPRTKGIPMSFDVLFTAVIASTMYVAWYAGRAPSGVSVQWHVLAVTAATYLVAFFVYFMVAESPHRPMYHTVLVSLLYCTLAVTYAIATHEGCRYERNRLMRDKSR